MIAKCPSCGGTDFSTDGFCSTCGQLLVTESVTDRAGPSASAPAADATVEPPAPTALQVAEHRVQEAGNEEERQEAWQSWEDTVFAYYNDQFRIATLIGFSMAGKTFFANRIRRELALRKGWNVHPTEKTNIVKTEPTIECTQLVHQGKPPRRRLLADCDGEAYRESVAAMLEGANVQTTLRRYVLITALASAYVLMVPVVRPDNSMPDDDTDMSKRFDVIVSAILALQWRLREVQDVKQVVRDGLTAEMVRTAKLHEFHCDRPIHILFAQADRFKEVQQHDADPLVYAMRHAKKLYRVIDKHFATYRFDFVSAFAGHKSVTTGVVNYDLPEHGALAAFDWIDAGIERPRLWRHSTRAALAARGAIDGEFRNARRKANQ